MSSLYTPLETKLIAAPFFKTLEREDLPGLSTNAPKKPSHEEECQHLCQRPLQQYTCNKLEQQLNWQRIVKVMGWGKKWYIYIFLNKRLLVVGIIHTNRNPREFHRVYSMMLYTAYLCIWVHLHIFIIFCLRLFSLQQNVTAVSVDGNDEFCELSVFFLILVSFSVFLQPPLLPHPQTFYTFFLCK